MENTQETLTRLGALKHGHFRLTSGLHSDSYMQCAALFEHPEESERLCRFLADRFRSAGVNVVAGPAIGGIIMAYSVAHALGARAIFSEREEGKMAFRRGFGVKPGEKALVVEDVVTTGGSTMEVIGLLHSAGADIVGVASIVDRSGGKAVFGVPFYSLMVMNAATWTEEECPLCRNGDPIDKPGSRNFPPSLIR